MKLELNGKITEGGEWDVLHIDGQKLTDFASELEGKKGKVSYYTSNEPIDPDKVVEKFLEDFYSGKIHSDDSYCAGSSWTGIYSQNDILKVGGHNIIDELSNHIGEYCYLIIEAEDTNT